jgi:hypothetical protein
MFLFGILPLTGFVIPDVYLFESRKEAKNFKASLGSGGDRRCHGHTKNVCGGTHSAIGIG